MFANPITNKIEMTKTEAAKAGKFGTKEFKELGALMDRFSSYEIVVVNKGSDNRAIQRDNTDNEGGLLRLPPQ